MPLENQCFITGNLGKDPEAKYTGSGKPYCKFTVAASHKEKDREYTEWVPVQVWGPLAESCAGNLQKGSRVMVRGKFQTSRYKDGTGKDKYFTQVVAEQVAVVLPGSPYATGGGQQKPANWNQFGEAKPEAAPAPKQAYVQPTLEDKGSQEPFPEAMGPEGEEIPF